jgi:hypothetical protein
VGWKLLLVATHSCARAAYQFCHKINCSKGLLFSNETVLLQRTRSSLGSSTTASNNVMLIQPTVFLDAITST